MADPTPQLENRPWGLSPNTAAWVDEVIQSDAVVLQLQQVVDSIERALEDDFDRLLEVCQTDNLDEFEAVVHRSEFHTRLVNQPMPGGATPLWVATCSGSTKCVLALLDTKANPFEAGASASGFSPLHVACELGNTTIVSALLAGAPKAGTTTDSGQTAQALVNEMSGSSNTFPLYNAAKSGHLDIVRMLIAAGARINCLVLPEGATALHAAREGGHSQVVEALLTAGAEDFSPTPAEWTHVDPDSGESEELEYAGSDGNEFSRGVEASTLDYTISPGRVGRRHSMPEVRVAATSAEGGGGGAMTSDSDDLDAIPRSRVRRSTIGASFQTSTARRTRSLKKASGRRKIRARTRSGLYGCGSREQVHVIQQQTLRKRINWSADFHDRFFRLLRVVVPSGGEGGTARKETVTGALQMPEEVRFFIEFYRDSTMAELRERFEIDASSSVEVWASRKGEGLTWKFKAGNGKRFYAKTASLASLESWMSKMRDIIAFCKAERPFLLS